MVNDHDARVRLAARLMSIAIGIADLNDRTVPRAVLGEIAELARDPGRGEELLAFIGQLQTVLDTLERETNLAERQDA